MMNLEIYEKDPRTHTLLNQGVAKVTSGQSSAETRHVAVRTLELRMRRGQYAEGLKRKLSTHQPPG